MEQCIVELLTCRNVLPIDIYPRIDVCDVQERVENGNIFTCSMVGLQFSGALQKR